MFVKKRLLALLILTLAPSFSFAQMFSISDRQERVSSNRTFMRIGTAITDFSFRGSLQQIPSARLLELSRAAFVFSIEGTGLQANAIIANNVTGMKDGSFFDLNLRFTNNFAIIRQQRLQAGLPFQLSTGLTTSNNDFSENRFNQTIFAAGTGLFTHLTFNSKTKFEADGVIGYGFSNSNGGFFGGNLFYMTGRARFIIDELIFGRSISFGYDYSIKSFDIDVETYDYDLTAHLLTIGVAF